MNKPKVLISDSMSSLAVSRFEELGVDVVQSAKLSPDELLGVIDQYDGLAVRSATKVTPELLAKASRLKVVGRAGIGVDNIDVKSCTAAGILVMNTPFGNAITTAEHAISMMLALARHIPQASESTRAGKWEKSKFMGIELTGKTLGIIGSGNIGSIVAAKALGFGLKVQAYDPFLTNERAESLGVRKVELDELLGTSDVVSLHVPRTPDTANIINATALNKMKKGSMLINCARGGLVDENALFAALQTGHLRGAALDVFEEEPARENPLFDLPNVICTPHLGASTVEAQEKVAIQVAEQMADFLVDGAIKNALNAPNMTAEEATKLKPYLQLSQQLGSFIGQLTHDPINAITVTYGGDASKINTKPVTAHVVQSVLEQHSANVNAVNALEIAAERNINVTNAVSQGKDEYQCRVMVEVKAESETYCVAGTLISNRPRLINVKGISLESQLGPHMLYVTNQDQPGVVGAIGTMAGSQGINIANLHLGRRSEGNEAVALLEIDDEVTTSQIEVMRGLPGITDVQYLNFASPT